MTRRYVHIVLLLLLWIALQTSAFANNEPEQGRNYFPPVLMYHDIKITPLNGFDVSLQDFAAQLDWLTAEGYRTLSMDEFMAYVKQKRPFPEKSVLITFDDGYEGIYKYAAPELIKRNMHATFFIFQNGIDSALTDYPYVTTKELKELAANPLFSIGSHTISHADLSNSSKTVVQQEVADSKKFIEAFTGKSCRVIAYPFGHYNRDVLEASQEAGYEAAFSVSDLGLLGYEAKYTIPRIYMGVIMSKNNMALFKKYITEYKNMPPAAFAERFGELPKGN